MRASKRWFVSDFASPTIRTTQEPATKPAEAVASPLHTIILLLVLFGVSLLGYRSVHEMRTAQNANHLFFYSITMAWEWIVVAYIYWGVHPRGKSLRDIVRGNWSRTSEFFIDIAISLGFWIAALVVLTVVARAIHATGTREAALSLAPHGLGESILWVALSVTAGFCEETIFRGYLQRQFAAWTRSAAAGVVLSAALFGAGHIYQGVRATVVIGVYGLMFGILAEARRSLRPGIMVHAWHDAITGLLLRFLPNP
jgi:membrane protease YdiL (CAAX protease family)